MARAEKLTVLITGADHPTGLNTARALTNLGIRLIGMATNPSSRFCRSRLWNRIISLDDSTEAYLATLTEIGRSSYRKIVLLPTQDDLVQLVSDNRDELNKYYDFLLPDKSVVDLLIDKTAFHQWALEHNFPVPESYVVQSQTQLDHVLQQIKYPVVIKPLFRTHEWEIQSPTDKIIKLESERDAAAISFNMFEAAPRYLIQQWIPGGDANVHFCLSYIGRDGDEVAYYTGRKLLQWPIQTGSTAIGVGTVNEEVHNLTKDVLRAARLRGLGSLEVKRSDDDNRFYITEPTVGRNNLQSYLAVSGGVNLTRIAVYDAIHEMVGAEDSVRKMATWVEEYATLQAVRDMLHTKGLRGLGVLRQLTVPISFGHLSLRDPMPFVGMCKELLQGQRRKVLGACKGDTYK